MKRILPVVFFLPSIAFALSPEEVRLGCRRSIMNMARAEKEMDSPILSHDRAEDLIDSPSSMITTLKEMEARGLSKGSAAVVPWSDSYWPTYLGGLGQRYNDPEFRGYDWKSAYDYVKSRPASDVLKRNEADLLSPAEKYDALLGLNDFPLTASGWQNGNEFFRRSGRVESWMGLCHGWAPASFMMPEPKKNVTVNTPNGPITFHPSDIKSYATLLWANGGFRTRFIGGRCNSQDPDRDRQGRVTEEDCLDNNPGTFHLAVVNQLGISRRPFIMDAQYSYQVWNHPVFSYEYRYYNPKTKEDMPTLAAATIPSSSWPRDPRKSFRAPGTKFFAGVRMTVRYAVENSPSAEEDQTSESSSAEYEYDLELDANGAIIGGEWYSDEHPDFLWVPEAQSFPGGSSAAPLFALDSVPTAEVRAAKIKAVQGVTSAPIVRAFVNASSKTDNNHSLPMGPVSNSSSSEDYRRLINHRRFE